MDKATTADSEPGQPLGLAPNDELSPLVERLLEAADHRLHDGEGDLARLLCDAVRAVQVLRQENDALRAMDTTWRASQKACEDCAPELAKLARFGAWCAKEFRDSLADVDGGSAQDAMERLGVIEKHMVAEPCGEGCVCVEYGDFPHECFKFPPAVAQWINEERA